MKRSFSSESKLVSKKHRQGDNTFPHQLRFLVPSALAGAIIGKGGQTIEKLRQSFDGTISLPNSHSPERVLIISTKSVGESIRVYFQVMDVIEHDARSSGNPQYSAKLEEHNVRLLLHQNLIGGLIGPGGSKVTKLRERTHARIKIYGECCPRSSERVVEISGKSASVKDALEDIVLSSAGASTMREYTPYDPNDYDPHSAARYGGCTRMDSDDQKRDGLARSASSSSVNGGRYFHQHGLKPRSHSPAEPSFTESCRRAIKPLVETCQVSVPSALVGQIIGPCGSQIQLTRTESNASINIQNPVQGSDDCIITIVGTKTEIEHAVELLRRSVRGAYYQS